MAASPTIETAFLSSQRRLWDLCYRMTGVAADADDLVQETFVRAIEASPSLQRDELERWLVRVATNLSLDSLRRRKRRRYPGPWLPSPVEDEEGASSDGLSGAVGAPVDARYERAEQVSYAFMVALEALGPRARAALLLTDVLDYAAAEVAAILETTEGNVRVLHHRARRAIEARNVEAVVSRDARDRQRVALQRFVMCMTQQDAAGMEALLTDDVRSITDGGGRYTALKLPLIGRKPVVRFHLETARRRLPISRSEIRLVNGVAALIVETRPLRPQMAPRLVLRCEAAAVGRICELQTVLAPGKLTAVRFGPAEPKAL